MGDILLNWKDLSVSKKLYCVVGIMALLIATELFTLFFAMNTLSAVRSFVGGEGLWSKAQKTAVRNLQSYALTKDHDYYDKFIENLKVPLGDRRARLELEKEKYDPEEVRQGFLQGRIHPDDIDGLINVIRRFHKIPHLRRAIEVWREADILIDEFVKAAEELHASIQNNADADIVQAKLIKIYEVDTRLTEVEDRFSYILGEGSRWLEKLLMLMLICTIVIVEGSGLFLTFKFSKNLNRTLDELNHVAQEVGKKNFNEKVPVRSKDELGQLALAINKMTEDLKNSLGLKDKAISDSHLKTIFMANMSHEIRTPVGIILGFTELLKDPHITQHDRDHYIDTIHRTSNNLLRIINDILDVSRVESGYIEVSVSKFKFAPFLKNLASILEIKSHETKNNIIFKSKGKIPEEIITDETRLHQILLNLVNNALKFTEKGTIEVSYWIESKNLHFEVSDTGTGIDQKGKEKLFRLFSQVDSVATRKPGGSGLGLVLSKRLANLLGGDVILKYSEPNKGSIFACQIKLHDKEHHTPTYLQSRTLTNEDLENFNGKNILVVEDSVDNQLLVKVYLVKVKANVHFASNGNEGVEKALSLNPDIVLMDIQMPVKDGCTATQELRNKGFSKPIIALTANAMKEDRERCLQAGCNDYLTKPLEINSLYFVLLKHLKS